MRATDIFIRFQNHSIESILQAMSDFNSNNRNYIEKTPNKGEFWKPCPGTTQGYLCCGYQILTPQTGCGMYCAYCILQAYFDHQNQVLYINTDELINEIERKMAIWKGVVRFGTGEFGDSLYSEHITGAARMVASVLDKYPNSLVEFKTKSTNIELLDEIKHPQKVVIGFSMNTPSMIAILERDTASLEQRLDAARVCVEMGFTVAFHFDPMIIYDGWEQEYRDVVGMIYSFIKEPSRIAWCSMGGFRCMPSLKTLLKKNNSHLPLFSGEQVIGADGKVRYFRPLRVALYKMMQNAFNTFDPACTLYLCMESPEVWKEAGMDHRIPNGLADYLDRRAETILGLNS
jgi:spore photoproduct lyase